MFLHVVLMKFTPAVGAAEHAEIEAFCERVRRECAGLLRYEYATNVASRGRGFDRVIHASFTTSAAHDAYQVSPAHMAMKERMGDFIDDILVCDCEIPDAG